MKIETSQQFKQAFEVASNDEERWDYILQSKHLNPLINLDNDMTFVTFDGDDDWVGHFDYFLGWADGITILMKSLGIRSEEV